jgi:hypothetical protein
MLGTASENTIIPGTFNVLQNAYFAGCNFNNTVTLVQGIFSETNTFNVMIGYNTYNNYVNAGTKNVSLGCYAGGYSYTTAANSNVCIGYGAGQNMTTGTANTYVGYGAGGGSTSTGNNNTCFGNQAGYSLTNGVQNSCFGLLAGYALTSGQQNCLIGGGAGQNINTGQYNVCIGNGTGNGITNGTYNVAIGKGACASTNGSYNTAIGSGAYASGNYTNSTAIGYNANVTANYQIVLGTANEYVYHPGVTQLGALGQTFYSSRSFVFACTSSSTNNPNFTATFGVTYPDASKLVVNITINNNGNYPDCFIACIRSVSTTSVTFNLLRVDVNGGWGATPLAYITVTQVV